MERVVGTLFALSLLGSTVCASAESSSQSRGKPIDARAKNDAKAKTTPQPQRFERLLSNAEADEAAYRAFLESADVDQDARVNAAELVRAVEVRVQARVALRFQHLDRDHDGRVARTEVPRMDGARFARFDADHDGSFTVGELARAMMPQVARRCGRLLARLDFDGDGALSAADLEPRSDQRVARLELATLLTTQK